MYPKFQFSIVKLVFQVLAWIFTRQKTVCFSAASLLFAKDTLDSMVLNEASFGFICLHVSIVAQYFVELTFL